MATKDHNFSFKNKHKSEESCNGRYSNLNLNHNNHYLMKADIVTSKNIVKNDSTKCENYAYENATGNKNDGIKKNKEKAELSNTWKNSKFTAFQAVYEFPRQQKETDSNNPEVMQFKASQQLFNPNQPPAATEMSRNIGENEHDVSGDYVVCDDEDDGIDNEDTIAEDELHELDEDNDLAALQAEAEMDIEELRKRYYGAVMEANEGQNAGSSDTAREDEEGEEEDESSEEEEGEEVITSELVQFMNTANGDLQGYGSDDDDDEYAPKIYKPPRVGPEYQHLNIPEVDSAYKAVHDHADVLWRPTSKLNDQQLDQYQESVLEFSQDMDASKLPALQNDPVQPRMDRPIPFWDSEEALYALMQNDYDPVRAKKAFSEGPPDVNLPRKTHFGIYLPWEEEDLLKFETGLHVYLKKFNKIQQEYLPGRSLGEVIHFYYRWKKTERFDMWRQQHHQAYAYAQDLQPNSTDIMENIIELIERDDVPAAEANVLVAEAQAITAKIHGQPPP